MNFPQQNDHQSVDLVINIIGLVISCAAIMAFWIIDEFSILGIILFMAPVLKESLKLIMVENKIQRRVAWIALFICALQAMLVIIIMKHDFIALEAIMKALAVISPVQAGINVYVDYVSIGN